MRLGPRSDEPVIDFQLKRFKEASFPDAEDAESDEEPRQQADHRQGAEQFGGVHEGPQDYNQLFRRRNGAQ